MIGRIRSHWIWWHKSHPSNDIKFRIWENARRSREGRWGWDVVTTPKPLNYRVDTTNQRARAMEGQRAYRVVIATISKRRQNKASILASILASFSISKQNQPAYSRTCKDHMEANPAYSTPRKIEAKRILFIQQIRKTEAERTLFIPQIGNIEAKRSLFIPQIERSKRSKLFLFHKLKRSKVCLFHKFERLKRSELGLFQK